MCVHPRQLHRDGLLRRELYHRDEPRSRLAEGKQHRCSGVEVATVDTGAGPNSRLLRRSWCTGWDFWDGGTGTTDVVYHGTYTASLISAQPNNGLGIAGVAPDATLMPVKVLGPNEEWVNANIVSGLNYAVNAAGVKAVNISLAGLNSPVPGIQDAMQNAENKGVLLVFAAGNWGADHDNPAFVPSFDGTGFDNVLTVAASTHWNTIAFFSDYGQQSVDIAAPGEGIAMDTIDGSDTATSYGTSFAAPLVTGVAALLFSAYPKATAAEVKEAICNGATYVAALMSKVRCGLLNAEGALQALGAIMAEAPAAPSDTSPPATGAGGTLSVGQTLQATTGSWTNSPAVLHVPVAGIRERHVGLVERDGARARRHSTYTIAAADRRELPAGHRDGGERRGLGVGQLRARRAPLLPLHPQAGCRRSAARPPSAAC